MKVPDYGRGIPPGKLIDCVSIINTGANKTARLSKRPGASNGVCQKAVIALSLRYGAQAISEGESKVVEFEKGISTRAILFYGTLRVAELPPAPWQRLPAPLLPRKVAVRCHTSISLNFLG